MAGRPSKKNTVAVGTTGLVMVALAAGVAAAAPGDPDPTFAGDGTLVVDLGGNGPADSVLDSALDSQGRLVVVGQESGVSFVARLLPDGTPDPDFGTGGFAAAAPAGTLGFAAVAVDGEDRVLAAVSVDNGSNSDIGVIRWQTDGSLDGGFAGDGRYELDVNTDTAVDLAVQPNGRISVLGTTGVVSFQPLVANITDSGDPDLGFGPGPTPPGFTTFELGNSTEEPRALSFGTEDPVFGHAIYVAGDRTVGGNTDAFVARVSASGLLDNTFSGDGYTLVNLGNDDRAVDIVTDRDTKPVVVGSTFTSGEPNVLAARFNSTGELDATFSDDGVVTVDLGTGTGDTDSATGVALQVDGRVVIGAATLDELGDSFINFAAVRLLPNGVTDTTFSGDGVTVIPLGPVVDTPEDVQVDSAGRIWLVGSSNLEAGGTQSALIRLTGQTNRCNDRLVTVDLAFGHTATRRGDVIRGTGAADTVNGRGGPDVICGRGGNDVLTGGRGADRILGGRGGDTLNGGRGPDILNGGPGRDTCDGGQGQDQEISC
jgi:uncharacterized delta-60 repeat protein